MIRVLALLLLFVLPVLAQPGPAPQPGEVSESSYLEGRIEALAGGKAVVRLRDGSVVSADLPIEEIGPGASAARFPRWVRVGTDVVLYRTTVTTAGGQPQTYVTVTEPLRIPYLLILLGVFCACALVFGRGRGLRGLLGTAVSLLALVFYVVPQINAGVNPLLVTFVGAFGILVFSIYLVHGVNRKTTAALIGTSLATLLALVLAGVFTRLLGFTGLVSEEAFYAYRSIQGLDLVSLYLASVVIGALGAMNDVTVTQAAVVQALLQANPRYGVLELYRRAMTVGFDHIGSLVNTLVLAYSAGLLPAMLLIQQSGTPVRYLLNLEVFAAEIVSMLVGSTGLILAVPLTTLIAAYLLRGRGAYAHVERRWPSPGERRLGGRDTSWALPKEEREEE
ncbi:YibE/F-like protein [Calidithermus terrae]|uniref:YibE/F-like protein n=1 Tax=Calidithermus terrae TaxID=1408545 RepID=A0A399EQY1_9DEIN|nr:YibE/F-like protein [Calidithermus terrae]